MINERIICSKHKNLANENEVWRYRFKLKWSDNFPIVTSVNIKIDRADFMIVTLTNDNHY